MPVASWFAVSVFTVLGLLFLWLQRRTVAGTTLTAPWWWSVVSLLALASAELASVFSTSASDPSGAALRFIAATSTFCPLMALLGAKRPQDRGWQFIVFSLWFVLALPGLEWLLFGGVQELHAARSAFLMILILIGAINGIGGRLMPSSLLFAAGQGALVAPFLGLEHASSAPDWLAPAGMTALVASWALATVARRISSPAAQPLDRVWLDFRDAYGLVWSLRVLDRVNATGTLCMWPIRLGWRGFYRVDSPLLEPADELDESTLSAVADTLRTLLRRFVSPEWIENRLRTFE
jgi:hypothetical protein